MGKGSVGTREEPVSHGEEITALERDPERRSLVLEISLAKIAQAGKQHGPCWDETCIIYYGQ